MMMCHSQFNEEELRQSYQQAKEWLHSGNDALLVQAKERFSALGDYAGSASLAEKCQMLLTFREGNTVSFGTWEGKPIRWRVVDSSGKMRMLLAEDVVLEAPYNTLRMDVYWQTCSLRSWLNREFIQQAFSREQRMLLINTRRTNEPNGRFYTNAGLPTMDKVFVLSQRELEQYLPNTEDWNLGKWWWLRTPGCNLLTAEAVYTDGTIYPQGVNIDYPQGGVRPALWMLLRDY